MTNSQKKQDELREQKAWESIDTAVIKSESFIEKHFKSLLIGGGALVLLACAYLLVNQFYLSPRKSQAQAELFRGESYFRSEQDSLALYGDGKGFAGLIEFIKQYGSTPAGNVANAYAGIALARMEKYDDAIKYLKSFDGKDKLIAYAVEGAIGDCYANQDKIEDAAKQFEKAASGANDALLSPIYLKKAGIAYRQLNNHSKVKEVFTTIKNKYINSPEALVADKYIEEAELLESAAK